MREVATPDQILEELADKTAAQIDRLAPVAFDSAFREVTNATQFPANAERRTDTRRQLPFNYAEWVSPSFPQLRLILWTDGGRKASGGGR